MSGSTASQKIGRWLRAYVLSFCLGLIALLATVPQSAALEVSGRNATLRLAVTLPNNVAVFDVNRSFMSWADFVLHPAFDRLMMFDQHGARQMHVAESIDFSADGMSILIKIRDDSYWSYGERVVAADFARGLKRAAMAGSQTIHLMQGIKNSEKWKAGDYSEPLGIDVLGDRTMKIHLTKPFGYDLFNLMNMQANPYPPAPYDADGKVHSNGPYIIERLEKGAVTLIRNRYYRGARPHFDRIEFLAFNDPTAVDLFLSQDADVLIGPLGRQKRWLSKHYKNGIFEVGLARKYAITLATGEGVLPAAMKEAEFRRALYFALDRESFESADISFNYKKNCGYIPAQIACSDERRQIWDTELPWQDRLQRSTEIVKRYGYSVDRPLTMSLVLVPSMRAYTGLIGFLKSSWHAVGVNLEISLADTYEQGLKDFNAGKYQMFMNSYYNLAPHMYMFLPESIGALTNDYVSAKNFAYVQDFVSRASRSSGAEYEALITDAERYLMDSMTVIPVVNDTQIGIHADWLSPNQTNVSKMNLRYFVPKELASIH